MNTRIFSSATEVPWEDWDAVSSQTDTLWSKDFLQAIEESADKDLHPYYILIYEDHRPIFCAYFQQVEFATSRIKAFTQDLDSKGSIRKWLFYRVSDIARRLVQLFRFRILVNGNSLVTNNNGFRAAKHIPANRHQELLTLSIQELASNIPRSTGFLIKDVILHSEGQQNEWDTYWSKKGYHKFLPDPEMLVHLPSSWSAWEDYLGAMSSKYRQRAKSAYKKSKHIQHRELSLEELQQYETTLFSLFQQVIAKETFSLSEIDSTYFVHLKKALQEKFIVHGYFIEDQLIGFTSHILSETVPVTHFVGFDSSQNQPNKLYQRMLYDQIQLSLGYKKDHALTLSLGRTAMEIKSAVGAVPQAGPCYLHLCPRWMNVLAGPIMSNLKLEAWTPRNPFKAPIAIS
ncbi:MAG: hypothetical protein AAF587_23675 [Bacteroidota bacterium]